jgi:hypothetical protein
VPIETPLAVTFVPVTVTPEMSMFEFPTFVSVDVSEALLPTETVLKFKLAGFAPSCTVAVEPAPTISITNVEGTPFVASVTEPLMVAVEVGAKLASNVALPPAGITVEVESPATLYPAPAVVTRENVSGPLPPFRSKMVCELPVPWTTLPKLTLEGVAEICAWVPVPERGTVSGEFEASLVIVKEPVSATSVFGAN